jgi:RNA polymerase sigma-70 factor (ECF subfamily)
MTEEAILQGCLNKEATAQKALYEKYSPKMLAICYRYAYSIADAEDMLQESFIRIFGHIHQYERKGSLEGWIRRVVIHTSINLLKKNRKFSEWADVVPLAASFIQQEKQTANMQSKDIIECIRRLPVGYRTVLNLYAIEGYAHKEIAEMLHIEESTSRSQYVRAKQMLEKMLIRLDILEPEQQKKRS